MNGNATFHLSPNEIFVPLQSAKIFINCISFLLALFSEQMSEDYIRNTEHSNVNVNNVSAMENHFCTLVNPNRVQWDVLSPDAINN